MSESGPKKPEQGPDGRFITGNIGGGRGKGARSKLGEAFLEDMLSAWESQGPAAIQKVLETRPAAFLKIVSDLLPKDMNLNINHLDGMSDEQLLRRLATLSKIAAPLLEKMPLINDDPGPTASRH